MSKSHLKIVNLYPQQLNIYGDTGNLLVVCKRAQWRGIAVEVVNFNPGDNASLLDDADILLGGGGQDSGQSLVQADLLRIGPALRQLAADGLPGLVICGSYQLFGNYFKTAEGQTLEGIGVFDMHTIGGSERMIGNITTKSSDFGELIGYENHSGATFLGSNCQPLASVLSGSGNNGRDRSEGARAGNVLGSYLHGPLLPKNPQVADFLIAAALERRSGHEARLEALPDRWVEPARKVAKARPR